MKARSLRFGLSACVVGLAVAGLVAGCGDDTGGTGGGGQGGAPPDGLCHQDPLACDEGTTCGFDDEDGASMSCLPAGAGKAGDTCKNVAGKPECGEGLVCLQLKGSDQGACTKFCDGEGDCSGSNECAQVATDGGRKFFACAKL